MMLSVYTYQQRLQLRISDQHFEMQYKTQKCDCKSSS